MLSGELIGVRGLSGEIQREVIVGGGGSGTSDYPELDNKPSINGVELVGNKTSEELGLASANYVDKKVADLVNSAPETLDTLGEVAKAIEENADVVDALNSAIGNKADKTELADYVKNTDYATADKAGVMKINGRFGLVMFNNNGEAGVAEPSLAEIDGKVGYKPITINRLDYAVKKGLTTNTETLTDEEKAAAQSWLGIDTLVGDINTALTNILGV